jgi:hypothetical protein
MGLFSNGYMVIKRNGLLIHIGLFLRNIQMKLLILEDRLEEQIARLLLLMKMVTNIFTEVGLPGLMRLI